MRFHLKVDQMKRSLENQYDFTFKRAFGAIDDWNYGFIDTNNLKRFLRSQGHKSTKGDLVSILRRFDLDGDAKISRKEFELGIKSSLTLFGGAGKCKKQSLSRVKTAIRLPEGFKEPHKDQTFIVGNKSRI